MQALQKLYVQLQTDALSNGITHRLVFGEGSLHAKILLIGEAPGAQEEFQGRPFVGKAGKNLDGFLQTLGLQRQELYISNVVKIRPSKISPAGNVVNRPPNKYEIAFFKPYLMQEIALVQPQWIVTLGNTALSVFGNFNIGEVHGKLLQVQEHRLFPLYHPAAIIYNRSLQATYAEDLLALKMKLKENL